MKRPAKAAKRVYVRRGGRAANATRDAILAAARTVLVREGYLRLTTRRVAEIAGITSGNLTYHFPSKRQLLHSLIRLLVAEYSAGIDGFFADQSVPTDRKFQALIEWLMADSIVRVTNRIFRELWAMALHDPIVARAIDDFYDEGMQHVAQLLRRAHPTLSDESASAIASLLVSISEGTGILYGTRLARVTSHAHATAVAVEILTAAVHKAAAS